MSDVPRMEQLEAFLNAVDLDDVYQAYEDTIYGSRSSAFCVVCGEAYDDDNYRVTGGCPCTACGEEAVYPVEKVLEYCEELRVQ